MKIIRSLKSKYQLRAITLSVSILLMEFVTASDAFQADDLYQKKNYEQAHLAYLDAAKTGSPYVYYQLGTIYYNGKGTQTNILSALLWFSLAAEYKFNDSEQIVKQLKNSIDKKHLSEVEGLINNFKKKYGKQHIEKTYLPELNTDNLDKKITFGGEGVHDTKNDPTDKLFGSTSSSRKISDDEYDQIDDLTADDPFEAFNQFEEGDIFGEGEDENDELIPDAPPQKNPLDLPYLVTIDYDVAPDGSIRNISKIHAEGRPGNIDTAIYNYSVLTLAKPTFKGNRVSFINRGHIGIHRYDLMQIRGKHKNIYDWIRRTIKKYKANDSSQDRYKQAMFLLYYPWFPREEGTVESLLKELSEKGHAMSQYEYGLYLYREQIDPAQAIKWLSLASQYGVTNAQYYLAKFLQESPWVVKDEAKALFWYEQAAKKGHPTATLKSAELKLLATDETLRNQAEAIEILNNIESSQNKNPDYSYLVAISHLNGEFRDFPKVIKYLRMAISRGHTLNWDVTKWEDQLAQWTTGTVTIND